MGRPSLHATGPTTRQEAHGPLRTPKVAAGGRVVEAFGPTADHLARGAMGTPDVTAGGYGTDALGPPVQHFAHRPLLATDVFARRGFVAGLRAGALRWAAPRPPIDHVTDGSLGALDVVAGGRVADAARLVVDRLARGSFGTLDSPARLSWGQLGLDAPGPTVDHLARGSLLALDVRTGGAISATVGPPVRHLARGPLGTVDVTARRSS